MIQTADISPIESNELNELISAQEVIYLADDVYPEHNIQLIYTPQDLLLEVA